MALPRLSRRSHQEKLAPYIDGADLAFVDLLRGEACGGAWRIVEAYSASGGPFELHAAWSGGEGAGQEAKITVPRATRFAVFAASLSLKAANLSGSENRVGCNVADGYCVSANQYEVRGVGIQLAAELVSLPLTIPPFATHFRVDCADDAQLPGLAIKVYDGVGNVTVDLTGDKQPSPGVPLGAAGKVEVAAPADLRFRGVFLLSI
ncbi:MAG: hypothetical protein H6742_14320 [Alphaproteobacteria bacterium]|nr:hypothetical protein [Alphaproteobacteria bacterium]